MLFNWSSILRISDSLSDARALPLFQSTICAYVSNDNELSKKLHGVSDVTYYRVLKVVGALLKLLESFVFRCGTLYNRADLALANIFQDCLELVLGRRLLGDVQFEVRAMRIGLVGVVARLIFGGSLSSIRRGLLQHISSSHRGGRAGLVEEGDNVEGFVLFSVPSVML